MELLGLKWEQVSNWDVEELYRRAKKLQEGWAELHMKLATIWDTKKNLALLAGDLMHEGGRHANLILHYCGWHDDGERPNRERIVAMRHAVIMLVPYYRMAQYLCAKEEEG